MTDMMLTGRVLDAARGPAPRPVAVRRGRRRRLRQGAASWPRKIAGNAPLSNFAVMQALPRIADLSQPDGLFVESLMAAIAQGDDAAKERVRAFLEKRAGKVAKS